MHMSTKKKIKAVLFDLGKVIVHFNFDPAFKKLSRASSLSPKDIEDYFIASGLEVLYDGGKISSAEFYRQVKKATGLRLDYAAFKKVWNGIFTPNQPIVRLIRRLSPRYRLVLISNTNAMHYAYIRQKYSILDQFDQLILSYKEKIRKPDERIYRKAEKACRARAAEILYIDDRADLTEAADSLGFNTFTYKNNPEALIQTMKKLGIL